MSEWKTVRLGDVCEILNGYAFKSDKYVDSGIRVIRITNVQKGFIEDNSPAFYPITEKETLKDYELYENDLLISLTGNVGRVALLSKEMLPAALNQRVGCIRIRDKNLLISYLFTFLNSDKFESDCIYSARGIAQKNMSTEWLKNYFIPLPPIEVQIKIANNLNTCAKIIKKHSKQLNNFDLLIKSRFIEMFGDPHNNTKYPYKNVGEFTTVTSGGTPDRKNKEYWKNGKIPWVKTTELQNNELTEVEEFITQKGLDESSAKMMPKGTLLIAMYGQGKTRGMTAYLGIEASTNQACACILPSKEINQRYLWYYFILSYDKLRDLAKGGNQPNLNGNMIKSFPVLMPPIDMQNKYVSFVKQIDKSKFEYTYTGVAA